jgi:hypothetical protein
MEFNSAFKGLRSDFKWLCHTLVPFYALICGGLGNPCSSPGFPSYSRTDDLYLVRKDCRHRPLTVAREGNDTTRARHVCWNCTGKWLLFIMKVIRNKHTSWQNAVSLIITIAGVYNYHFKLVKGTNTLRAGNLHWIIWGWWCHANNVMCTRGLPQLFSNGRCIRRRKRMGQSPLRNLWTRTHPVKRVTTAWHVRYYCALLTMQSPMFVSRHRHQTLR